MGRLLLPALLLALLAGGAMTFYNLYLYEMVSPVPLSWTHSPAELELAELQRIRAALTLRLGSARRIGSASGFATLAQEKPGADIEAELAVIDQRIAALEAQLAAGR
jgi:hypothetical protein